MHPDSQVEGPDIEEPESDLEQASLVPYAPDFTPATLGKVLGEDKVLGWLLDAAEEATDRRALLDSIASTCLQHITEPKNRRDMASHVVQGLENYGLLEVDDADDRLRLTEAGKEIRAASETERDAVFARHILSSCNGYRLVEAIQRHELRNSQPTMEELSEELDRSRTSKSLSTMKAWLTRAGVMRPVRHYAVDSEKLERLLGAGALQVLGLEKRQLEFLLAARVLAANKGDVDLEAADIKLVAETRAPDLKIPSKGLGRFVARLGELGFLEQMPTVRSRGGNRGAVRLTTKGFEISDEQIRGVLRQSSTGFQLSDLPPMSELLRELPHGTPDALGRRGEMLALHVCLMIGLRVVAWRKRLPVEVDLVGERSAALSYQRWHIQVKNIEGDLDSDRVDREVGAAAGTGATHLLFIVPRGNCTGPARSEILSKGRLTHLHIYVLTSSSIGFAVEPAALLRSLLEQQRRMTQQKRREAERREQE